MNLLRAPAARPTPSHSSFAFRCAASAAPSLPPSTQQQTTTTLTPQLPTAMEYRKLGNTGLDVSVISYGSWVSFDYQLQDAKDIMQACYDAGINFFDNAEVYAHGKSEEIMGRALRELDFPRCNIVLSTKVFFGSVKEPRPTARGLSRKHVIEGVTASLQRLGVRYVDVVFAHRADPSTPMEEIVRAFNFVIDQGWAFYWGTSEWSAEQITEAHAVADRLGLIPPCVEQPQYNILHRQRVEMEYAPLYDSFGTGLTTFSPLACGLLSGKYRGASSGDDGASVPAGSRFAIERYKFLADRWLSQDKLAAAAALRPIAQELGCTQAQLAIAWCAANARVSTVLTGATSVAQVLENVKALEVVKKLTPEVLRKIDEAVGGGRELAMGKM